MKFIFKSSSTDEEYTVTVEEMPGEVSIFCTCPAGSNGTHCKHRLAILDGDDSKTIRATHPAAEVKAVLAGTQLGASLDHLKECEMQAAEATANLKAAKKQLARAMEGRF